MAVVTLTTSPAARWTHAAETKGACIGGGATFAAVDRAALADSHSHFGPRRLMAAVYHLAATGRRLIMAGAGVPEYV